MVPSPLLKTVVVTFMNFPLLCLYCLALYGYLASDKVLKMHTTISHELLAECQSGL